MTAKRRGKQPEVAANTSKQVEMTADIDEQSGEAAEKVKKPKTASSQPAAKVDKVKRRRLHVAGLPDISEQEAKDRFKSFGKVVGVDGLGKLDGNGAPLRYAFIDIETTKAKISQCMNLLSGSIWKGSTLRIAEARRSKLDKLNAERKKDFREAARLAADEASTPPTKPKKRKRMDGTENSQADLVSLGNVKDRAGWKLDPITSTPIFPLIVRPDRPLPPAIEVPQSSVSEPASKSKPKMLSAEDKKAQKAVDKAARKAARKAEKISASNVAPTRARRVKIDPMKWQTAHLREDALNDSLAATSLRTMQTAPATDEQMDQAVMSSSGESSEASEVEPVTEDGVVGAETVDFAAERKMHMALLESMLGVQNVAPIVAKNEAAQVVSSSEDESGESEAGESEAESAAAVAAVEAEIQQVEEEPDEQTNVDVIAIMDNEDESSDNSDSTNTVHEDGATEDAVPAVAEPAVETQTHIQMQRLTDMFKPQEEGAAFMLGDLLEGYELEDLPIPQTTFQADTFPSIPSATVQYTEAQIKVPASRQSGDPHEPLFFLYPMPGDLEPDGLLARLSEEKRNKVLEKSWTGTSSSRRFKRTQTLEEITTQHEAMRRVLNEQVRKRHREAVKRKKRGGFKDASELGLHLDD